MELSSVLRAQRPYMGVSKRERHSCLRLKGVWRAARRFGPAYVEMDCVLLEQISLGVIAILIVRAKKLVSVENAPSAQLRGKISILASLWFQV